MILLRTLMALLPMGLLLLPGVVNAKSIQCIIDRQGIIHIFNNGSASQEKAGEMQVPSQNVEPKQLSPAEPSASSGVPAPESTKPHPIWWNGEYWVDEPAETEPSPSPKNPSAP